MLFATRMPQLSKEANERDLEDAIASLFPEDGSFKPPAKTAWHAAYAAATTSDGDWLLTIPAQFLTSDNETLTERNDLYHYSTFEDTRSDAEGPLSDYTDDCSQDGDSASSVSSASPDCLLAPPSQDAFVSSPPPPAANGRSRKSKASSSNYQWSREEHRRFVDALEKLSPLRQMLASHGRVTIGLGHGLAEMISKAVGTRSISQVRSHAQKYFQRINRERGYD
ncbi:hypothetical protein GUITHDRAFT_122903 [Guillardia theta CCMP2712]|uniref:Uncharacterized protein n=1 Tax=Guillardia theta (strain CCMP2712) TaxID=905079 RepID=L1I4A7_GUITC|nr:hypothetical protein GUITHDRAFT_122903 [Guillardia theta CCMP2712]EKX30892.1 hypothetical protein GUITHDRAFT_122903 [Guillardia theta CCMP2712]|eukprot:XP_005817872.1 hypothetical protein GUITHDRAFT_122903 [Guillardia theta CCMP2712]